MVKSYEIKRFYALFLALITLLAVVSAVFFAVDGQRQREKLLQNSEKVPAGLSSSAETLPISVVLSVRHYFLMNLRPSWMRMPLADFDTRCPLRL